MKKDMKHWSYQRLKKLCLDNTADVETIRAAAIEMRRRGFLKPIELKVD